MFVRRWRKQKSFRFWAMTLAIFVIIVLIHLLIFFGYQAWTGLNQHVNLASSRQQKLVWGWLPLPMLIVLIALAVATTALYLAASRLTGKVSLEKQREDILQRYLDRMSELMIAQHLRSSAPDAEVRRVARVQTLTALSQLDAKRQSAVLSFLREARLVTATAGKSIVALNQAYMAGINLSFVDLHAIDLSEANLRGANLCGADLREANLCEANLCGADLREAQLLDAHLHGANLSKTSWEKDATVANLSGAILYRADLGEAHLEDADLSGVYLGGANLCGADLRKANLSNANLFRADLRKANLREANLCGADLRKANLSDTNLSNADLSRADFCDADLSRADLRGARLSETNFSAARLTDARGLPPEFIIRLSLHTTQQLSDSNPAFPSNEVSGPATD